MTDRRPSAGTLDLVDRLVGELSESKVRYCHWKSNEAIDRSLSGDNDLDLLVHREDAAAFLSATTGLGFRPALPSGRRQIPGMLDLFGLDGPSGRLVHVQAHFRLVLGDDMTKNYRVPIESHYLTDLDHSGPLPLPRPEYEYLVFVLRMVLKHCSWDAQLSYKGRLTPSERRELAYLEERIEDAEVERLRAAHLPSVGAELFARCRGALEPRTGPVTRARPARELVAALRGYGARPPVADISLKATRRLVGALERRVRPAAARKRLIDGGSVVAVVGGDGSGKSSAVDDLVAFLGRHVVVRRLHLGKPRPSLLTGVARRVGRRLVPGRLGATGLPVWEAEQLDRFPGYPYLLWHLATARDRYRAHLAARRAAGRGEIVVCDRYPLAGLTTMDCPRLGRLSEVADRPLAHLISRLERAYYQRITAPDTVVVLRVTPETAVERRPEQDPEFVRRRAEEIQRRDWNGDGVVLVDADRPLDEALAVTRALVWAAL